MHGHLNVGLSQCTVTWTSVYRDARSPKRQFITMHGHLNVKNFLRNLIRKTVRVTTWWTYEFFSQLNPWRWHLGAETCRRRHWTRNVFYDLCFIVLYIGHFVGYYIERILQSALTPTALYAAPTNPWRETIYDNVPRYLTRRNVSDTGRLGQKWWGIDFVVLLLLFLFCDCPLTFVLLSVVLRPHAGHGLLILEVSWSHTTTHHSR